MADQPAAAVRTTDVFVPALDGTHLACRVWEPADGVRAGQPVAVLQHGVAAYGAPHTVLGTFLAGRGMALCAPDTRGHGRSGGRRGAMRSPRTVLLDLHSIVSWTRHRYPGHPLILIGESMGGLSTLNYAAYIAKEPRTVDALWLIAPGVMIHPRQVADFTVVRRTPHARRAATDYGPAMRAWRNAIVGSRDADWLAKYYADPLVLSSLNPSYMMIIVALSLRCPVAARLWTAPTLILHGKADGVVPYQASVVLHGLFGAEDKELALFPNVWHTVFADPDTPQVLARLDTWLTAHYP